MSNQSYSQVATSILNRLGSNAARLNNAAQKNEVINDREMKAFSNSISQISGIVKKEQNRFSAEYNNLRKKAQEPPKNIRGIPMSKYNSEINRLKAVIKNKKNIAAAAAKEAENKKIANKKIEQKQKIQNLKKSLNGLRKKVQGNNRG